MFAIGILVLAAIGLARVVRITIAGVRSVCARFVRMIGARQPSVPSDLSSAMALMASAIAALASAQRPTEAAPVARKAVITEIAPRAEVAS